MLVGKEDEASGSCQGQSEQTGGAQTAAPGLSLKMFQVTRFELYESASTDETFTGTFQASCSNRISVESLIIIIAQPRSSAADPTKTAIVP